MFNYSKKLRAKRSYNGDKYSPLGKAYSITVKKTMSDGIPAFREDLDDILATLPYKIIGRKYEIDKSNKLKRLHVHALFYSKSQPCYKDLKRTGWSVFVKPVSYLKGWLGYCNKDSSNKYAQDALLFEHRAMHENLFKYNDYIRAKCII